MTNKTFLIKSTCTSNGICVVTYTYYINNKKKRNFFFLDEHAVCYTRFDGTTVQFYCNDSCAAVQLQLTDTHEYCSAPPLSCNEMNRGNIEYFARYRKTRLLVLCVFCFVFSFRCVLCIEIVFFILFSSIAFVLLLCRAYTEKGNALNYCCVYTSI